MTMKILHEYDPRNKKWNRSLISNEDNELYDKSNGIFYSGNNNNEDEEYLERSDTSTSRKTRNVEGDIKYSFKRYFCYYSLE